MKTPDAVQAILDALGRQHPNADTELKHSNAFELLVATILSAQATDAGVNLVTPHLLATYPTAQALAAAPVEDVEQLVHATGFFRQKTRSLLGMSAALVGRHGGEVPRTMDALVKLPGVGRKTANVVLGHALGVPGFPVDRHVLRVANRLGIAKSDDPERVEQQVTGALSPAWWTRASDTLILHGRRICKPTPLCEQCAANALCDFRTRSGRPAVARGALPGRPKAARRPARKGPARASGKRR
ncbi:MAG: endonuclease III [Acidobacteria bacterium]|nr:endonuclease III [Acidobacteriota bacterium]